MRTYLIDGTRHSQEVWYALSHNERAWRGLVCCSTQMRETCIRHEVREIMAESTSSHVYGYRYLEPEDLNSPWTPELLLAVEEVSHVAQHYARWASHGSVVLPIWAEVQDVKLPDGERLYAGALQLFTEAELTDWATWVIKEREKFRKRIAWRTAGTEGWVPFQVDINSPPLFLDVTGPAVWQTIVDAIVEYRSHDKSFVEHMKMASIEYIVNEIPGPHGNPFRKFDLESPFGYGTSTQMPSFGYRREHRSEVLFVGWATAVMPQWDLLGPRFWPSETESVVEEECPAP